MELVVNEQIIQHFDQNDLFHPNLHGGLAHHSTATALIQLHDLWLTAADRKELSATCLLDQSAAFDLLSHSILREKLLVYNFDEGAIRWVMSYLQNRTQMVQIENKRSQPIQCGNFGAPQGSVLAGTFDNINGNYFPACHSDCPVASSVVYVDDDSDNVHAETEDELCCFYRLRLTNLSVGYQTIGSVLHQIRAKFWYLEHVNSRVQDYKINSK